ncbi:MAG: hypothetical protein NZ602_10805 [Thermoguttaceae bacterium]|nr:hypothetical protein [Thermoguttaceae bacterium]MDW8038540.1 hypothetical protein [Thermoguttaceae bacterium]
MSRLLKALQRVATSQQAQHLAQENAAAPTLALPDSALQQQTTLSEPKHTGTTSPWSQEACAIKRASEGLEAGNSAELAGGRMPRTSADFRPVIERLRQRILPGRQPAYCQMAAQILEQASEGPSTVFMFMGFAGEPVSSVTVAPLAAVLGEAVPEPILALDARAEGPELAECFGLWCRYRLKDLLLGQVPLYEAVRKSTLGQLFLLGGSPAGELDWSAISETSWKHMMGQLRKHYRLILIDAGCYPHPAQHILQSDCDGLYLVIQLGRTPKRLIQNAVQQLQQVGVRVLGCIAGS